MLTFGIGSDLYCAGRRDDGSEFHAERFYVFAEDARGNRWTHGSQFAGCAVHWSSEVGCNFFEDIREEARARAERLLARILAAGGRIDLQHWGESRPVYGSPAYEEYGQWDDIALERAEG